VAAPGVDADVAEFVGVEVGFVAGERGFPAVPIAAGAIMGSTTAPPPAG